MASHFSANQYEGAFTSKALQNWEVSKQQRGEPRTQSGYTKIIGDDEGHLLENIPRTKNNPWGNYTGTWDLPKKIAGNSATNTTGRTSLAQQKLSSETWCAQEVLSGKTKNEGRLARLASGTKIAPPVLGPALVDDVPIPTKPVEVMCDEVAPGRSPTPPMHSPLAPNPALIDADDKPLFRSADL